MNTSYIILLFYDIPNNNKIERKRYTKFNNFIKSIGFIMLQESVYMKSINNKQSYKTVTRDLKLIAPNNSNIRTILITQNNFEEMLLINGEQTFKEKILSKKTRVLEL